MTVFWITGLPGAGKTTVATVLFKKIKSHHDNVILLDGDSLRTIFADEINFDYSSRKSLAKKYSMLSKYISEQGVIVIIATVSMFHEIRDWNRKNIDSYIEVYVKVPLDILASRDQKNLYSKGARGEISNVLGLDVDFEEPLKPDIILENNGVLTPSKLIEQIFEFTEIL